MPKMPENKEGPFLGPRTGQSLRILSTRGALTVRDDRTPVSDDVQGPWEPPPYGKIRHTNGRGSR